MNQPEADALAEYAEPRETTVVYYTLTPKLSLTPPPPTGGGGVPSSGACLCGSGLPTPGVAVTTAGSLFFYPAVIAAIVATPSALVAAAVTGAAAYAAGRAQALGAHRGPVDAVRRQHQRDAYAAFLEAAVTYRDGTELRRVRARAWGNLPDMVSPAESARISQRARELRLEASQSVDGLHRAYSLVLLEGPAHIADLARAIKDAALQVRLSAHGYFPIRHGTETDSRPHEFLWMRPCRRRLTRSWSQLVII